MAIRIEYRGLPHILSTTGSSHTSISPLADADSHGESESLRTLPLSRDLRNPDH